MTEREKVELLMTGVRFTCKSCGRECIGPNLKQSHYLWCPSCLAARLSEVVAAGAPRFVLPLEENADE